MNEYQQNHTADKVCIRINKELVCIDRETMHKLNQHLLAEIVMLQQYQSAILEYLEYCCDSMEYKERESLEWVLNDAEKRISHNTDGLGNFVVENINPDLIRQATDIERQFIINVNNEIHSSLKYYIPVYEQQISGMNEKVAVAKAALTGQLGQTVQKSLGKSTFLSAGEVNPRRRSQMCFCCGGECGNKIYRRDVYTGSDNRISYGRSIRFSQGERRGMRSVCSACAAEIDAKKPETGRVLRDAFLVGLMRFIGHVIMR